MPEHYFIGRGESAPNLVHEEFTDYPESISDNIYSTPAGHRAIFHGKHPLPEVGDVVCTWEEIARERRYGFCKGYITSQLADRDPHLLLIVRFDKPNREAKRTARQLQDREDQPQWIRNAWEAINGYQLVWTNNPAPAALLLGTEIMRSTPTPVGATHDPVRFVDYMTTDGTTVEWSGSQAVPPVGRRIATSSHPRPRSNQPRFGFVQGYARFKFRNYSKPRLLLCVRFDAPLNTSKCFTDEDVEAGRAHDWMTVPFEYVNGDELLNI
jgi:hypothetical protein